MCILSVYTLLYDVGYYDLSVLSTSVIEWVSKQKVCLGEWAELYPIFGWIFGIVLTLQSP